MEVTFGFFKIGLFFFLLKRSNVGQADISQGLAAFFGCVNRKTEV